MRRRRGCGLVLLGALLILTACLVFVALAAALVLTGELPLYAPRLTGFQPDPNYAFQPTTPITLTFDQPMDPASVEAAFAIEPYVPGSYHWVEDRSQMTFVADQPGYEFGMTYKVRLAAGAKAGTIPQTTVRPVEWSFSLSPLLDQLQPAAREQGLGPRPLLQAVFNYPLDCAATFQTFSITPEAVGILDCKDHTLAFSPTLPLEAGTVYVAGLENVYLQGDLTARPGVQWEFQTAPPLMIEEIGPEAAGVLVDYMPRFEITFVRPVVAESAVSRFSLSAEDGTPVAGDLTWEQDGARLVFQPKEPLRPASSYVLALHSGVQDLLGFELAEPLERSYATAAMIGTPMPLAGSKDVPLDSNIRVPFTRSMDKASVEAGLAISPAVEGQMTWEEDTLVFIPRDGLAAETIYQVSLSADIRDAEGAPLAETRQWEFVTEAFLLETQGPSGTGVSELQQPVKLSFALPMDPASVRAALTISPTTPVALTWSDDGRTFVFQPELAWQPGTDYEFVIAGSARTVEGPQTLGRDLVFSFSTAVAEVWFGDGPLVQVIGSEGNRGFQLHVRNADVADFGLYAITPTQFLDLYTSVLQAVAAGDSPIMDTSSLTPTVEWREALMPQELPDTAEWQAAEGHIPAEVSPGLYVLSALPPSEEQGELLVALTDHVLVLKRAVAGVGNQNQAQVVAWDTAISDGTAVVSATVHLYDRNGIILAEGLTGAGGLLSLDLPGEPEPVAVLADHDGDVTVCGLGSEWHDAAEGLASPGGRSHFLVYSYTDRPVYWPNQTVRFKQIIRADGDVSYSLPLPDQPVTVRLRDTRDNIAATQVLTPTVFGTVHGEFRLADELLLGTWALETEVEGATVRQAFEVQEARQSEYRVLVRTPQTSYVLGEPISVTVDAKSYIGQPVADADVILLAYPLHAGAALEGPAFSVEGQTDDQGRWAAVLSVEGILDDVPDSYRTTVILEATVRDSAGQIASGYQAIVVQPSSLGLALSLEQRGYRVGQEIIFSAVARDRNDDPAPGVALTAKVVGWDEQEVASASAVTDEAGRAAFSLALAQQGLYGLHVSATADIGRPVEVEDQLWIYDPLGQSPWYGGGWGADAATHVMAIHRTYAVGDEAQILVHAPVSGTALLTLERGETHHAELASLISGTNLLSVPIGADLAPNVDVAVSQFIPSAPGWSLETSHPEIQLQEATARILVPMDDRRLTVAVEADQKVYAPGEQATFDVRISDHEGKPVLAELSLALVDEAMVALFENTATDPFEAFYGPRPNLVDTFDSMRPVRRFSHPATEDHPLPGGGDLAQGDGAMPHLELSDTAYWAPAIVTDERGEATVAFELPDKPAEWRLLARAVTSTTLVGQASVRISVSQELLVQPSLPPFLVQGDAITLTADVHNFAAQPVSATVILEQEGLVLKSDASQVLQVPAHGSAMAAWAVAAMEAGQARVALEATARRAARLIGRDSIERTLPVVALTSPDVFTWAGELTPASPTATFSITVPTDVVSEQSSLELILGPSEAHALLQGLEALQDYPYGFVEQTMSRVLSAALVAQSFGEPGLPVSSLGADLSLAVEWGLQKLYAYQHDGGGWGWWYDDSTNVHETAYVLAGLAMTHEAGFEVDSGVRGRGAEALRQMLPGADPRSQAYGAYALAMAGQPVTLTLTLTDALDLDLFSQAALAIGLEVSGGDLHVSGSPDVVVEALLDNLRQAAIEEAGTVHWQEAEENVANSRSVMGSSVRTTAMVVDALLRLEPDSPLLPGAVRWLMEQRQGRGWGDTQSTSYVILALADYLSLFGEQATGSLYRVYLNNVLWQEGDLEQIGAGHVLTLPVTALGSEQNQVQLALGAGGGAVPAGQLYYAAMLHMERFPQDQLISATRATEKSITVEREYRLEDGGEPIAEFQRGDLVEIQLTLGVPEEAWYVVIDDPLPAGFRAIDERMALTTQSSPASGEPVNHRQSYGYNWKQVGEERVSLFVSNLEPGQHTFTYLARATVAGNWRALPTQVYPMYEPAVWSRSDSTQVEITEP